MYKGTILYVGNFELPDKGASANRVMTNRLLFRECGYRTAFLGVTKEEQFDGVRKSSFDEDVYERVYPNSTKSWLERAYSLRDILTIASYYQDIKFIIFYNCSFSLVRKAYKHFQNTDIKVLYDCTEWKDDTEGSKFKQLYKKYDTYRIKHQLTKVVDGIIVVSSLMEKAYRNVPKILLPPLVDIEAEIWQQKKERNDGVFEFCYAGDPGKKDDLCLLIDSFLESRIENSRLQIIGVEQNAFLVEHPEYKTVFQNEKNPVIFMGRLPHKNVIRKLINTDCFIFIRESSLRNNAGFPTKFVEAYTSGTRVVATNVSDVAYYKTEGVFIIYRIEQENIIKAMHEIMTLCCTSELRKSFDYRNYVSATKHFLSDILKNKKDESR